MKVLLMSLNSKYIHTNLALHYLKQYYEMYHKRDDIHLVIKEYTINNDMDVVLRDVVKGDYTHIFASAYIWNIEPLALLFSNYKKINQSTKIIFGGPEVTYNSKQQIEKLNFLNAIVTGEGERSFGELLSNIAEYGDDLGLEKSLGITYTTGNNIKENAHMPLINPLDRIPFPYGSLESFENKIIYYESSRGCPYSCSYCLSSASQGVRHLSIDRVKSDMSIFLNKRVSQVKFVDRTFNAIKEHALPIMKYLVENDNGVTNFHFEITATLLDETYFELLKDARPGLFQFEIGVQTTYQPTMVAIHRPVEFEKLRTVCKKLLDIGGIHLHLDLIAGLPHETYERFLKSFDDVYEIGADQLQLGFLKLLKGTSLAKDASQHGYEIAIQAPYEILMNRYISFDELSKLKEIETLLEYYSNSGKFNHSLKYLIKKANLSPSTFFISLSDFFNLNNFFASPIGTYRLYEILYDYHHVLYGESELFKDLLKVDYYFANLKGQRQLFNYIEIPNFNNTRLDLLKDEEFVKKNIKGNTTHRGKQLLKNVEFITLKYDIITLIQSDYNDACEKLSVMMFNYMDLNDIKMVSVDCELFKSDIDN